MIRWLPICWAVAATVADELKGTSVKYLIAETAGGDYVKGYVR
jgi:hypothetical protein